MLQSKHNTEWHWSYATWLLSFDLVNCTFAYLWHHAYRMNTNTIDQCLLFTMKHVWWNNIWMKTAWKWCSLDYNLTSIQAGGVFIMPDHDDFNWITLAMDNNKSIPFCVGFYFWYSIITSILLVIRCEFINQAKAFSIWKRSRKRCFMALINCNHLTYHFINIQELLQ